MYEGYIGQTISNIKNGVIYLDNGNSIQCRDVEFMKPYNKIHKIIVVDKNTNKSGEVLVNKAIYKIPSIVSVNFEKEFILFDEWYWEYEDLEYDKWYESKHYKIKVEEV